MQNIRIKRGRFFAGPDAVKGPPVRKEVRRAALVGADYHGLKATLAVTEGQRVTLGDTLFTDRQQPSVRFCAPASGVVTAIHRGARRSLQAVVLAVEDEADEIAFKETPGKADSAASVRETLQRAGLWPALRARPFDVIPAPDAVPDALFITAMDTRPGAPDAASLIAGHSEAFMAGLETLAWLAPRTYLCMAPEPLLPHPDRPEIVPVVFDGPHPAGLPGTHMHFLAAPGSTVWHIGYQDVIAVGKLFASGRLSMAREVAVGGDGETAQLVSTRIGAALAELVEAPPVPFELCSGSMLDPDRDRLTGAFLGRYHNQLWMRAQRATGRRSWWQAIALPGRAGVGDPAWQTGMLTVEAFDRVWPLRTPPVPLLRALLTEDVEMALDLGADMLAEEDFALCSYVCPAKLNYGAALRATHAVMERGG